MSSPRPDAAPISLNHVAYPTFDTAATVDFYTRVLQCQLVGAIQKEVVPSTGEPTPFLHTFFALSSGECLAFFEVEGMKKPEPDGIPSWIRHIALNVESVAAVQSWKRRLEAQGVEVVGEVDHDGTWFSIYFFDPNGIRIELTYQSKRLGESDAVEAATRVSEWIASHG